MADSFLREDEVSTKPGKLQCLRATTTESRKLPGPTPLAGPVRRFNSIRGFAMGILYILALWLLCLVFFLLWIALEDLAIDRRQRPGCAAPMTRPDPQR